MCNQNAIESTPNSASTVKPPKMFLEKLNKPGLLLIDLHLGVGPFSPDAPRP